MDLTASYRTVVAADVRARYEMRETRNAAAVLNATNPDAFGEVVDVLRGFVLLTADLLDAGGNESGLASRLNHAFRSRGWREGRVDTRIALELRRMPYAPAGEDAPTVQVTEQLNEGYKVDNVKDRIALDVEWNAKDGNLDRDISAYRALYDAGLVDGAVMISRTQADLRALATRLAQSERGLPLEEARKRLGSTTTTNVDKLMPKVTRGDLGGCPFLGVFVCGSTWERAAAEGIAPVDDAVPVLTAAGRAAPAGVTDSGGV